MIQRDQSLGVSMNWLMVSISFISFPLIVKASKMMRQVSAVWVALVLIRYESSARADPEQNRSLTSNTTITFRADIEAEVNRLTR